MAVVVLLAAFVGSTTSARPAAIDVCFTAVLRAVGAGGVRTELLVTECALAILVLATRVGIFAGIALSTTILVGLSSVAGAVIARRFLTPTLVTDATLTVGVLFTTFAILTRIAAAATVDVCFTVVFDVVGASDR